MKPPYLFLPFGVFGILLISGILFFQPLEKQNPDNWIESGDKGWEDVAKYVEADTATVGVTILAVRNDALVSYATEDGDYTHLQVDTYGAVWARCINPPETGRVRPRLESNFP